MKRLLAAALLILASVTVVLGEDPGWPRELKKPGGTLVYYQPQVDDWKNFTELTCRIAFSLTPAGGQEVVGVSSNPAVGEAAKHEVEAVAGDSSTARSEA